MTDTSAAPAAAPAGDNGGAAAPIGVSAAPTGITTSASATSPTIDWIGGADTDTVGYVQNKGWKDPSDVVQSYRNLEKLRGVPAERLLTLPTDLSDVKEMGQIFDKLGRPADAKGYSFGEVDKTIGEWAGNKFHELGLTKAQGETLMQQWNEMQKGRGEEMRQQLNDRIAADDKILRKEWGAAYDQNFELAKNAAKKLGFSEQGMDALLSTIGQKATAELFYKIGTGLGEDKFIGGNSPQGFNGAMTPSQAKNKINALRNDQEFIKRYVAGDVAAKGEMARLHEMAYHDA